jgi:hypothetical protein
MFLSALLFSFSPSFAALPAPSQLRQRMRERAEIIRSAGIRRKSANDTGTAAYFLGIPTASLPTDIRVADQFRQARISYELWSGYFWPNFRGGLGYRHTDPSFPRDNWAAARDYVTRRPSTQAGVFYLSPSEKYDTIMGVSPEENGSLTRHQWRMGEAEHRSTGTVATWQGICNGWAAAAVNFPNPVRSITFPTRQGPITLTPDDVRALGSLLYFNGKFESVYAGFRCNTNEPDTDRLGRVLTPECFDVNPADWHLIATQHLGQLRQPFIMDAMNSSQVWNKPVVGYSFNYFDIGNNNTSQDFRQVLRPISEAARYRRGPHRGPRTAWVVGVSMDVTHMDGTGPGESSAQTKVVRYIYDLELDAQYRIIGGEWISEAHPDFLWRPKYTTRLPETDGDSLTATLNPWEAASSTAWRGPALRANGHGAPLTKFIKYIFDYTGYSGAF